MRSVSAKNADSNFGALIEGSGRAGTVVKYGRPAVVELAVEEYARLKGSDAPK